MPVDDLPGFGKGQVSVQDIAAQLAAPILAPSAGQRVLDACAAPGGKTAHMLEFSARQIDMTALEISAQRCERMRDNLQRLGMQVSVLNADASDPSAWWDGRPFDRILLDAPCSGTGVIRKHPDIRWNRQPEGLAGYQQTQLELLQTAAALLKPGGVLVYATCSLESEENQQVVELFLAANAAFALTDCRDFLPASATSLVDTQGCFAPLPTEEIEGFFAARLVRSSVPRSHQ